MGVYFEYVSMLQYQFETPASVPPKAAVNPVPLLEQLDAGISAAQISLSLYAQLVGK